MKRALFVVFLSCLAGLFVSGTGAKNVQQKRTRSVPQAVTRRALTLPSPAQLEVGLEPVMALSPDGTRLVYVARPDAGSAQLYLRLIDRFEATSIPGTEGATGPFFSPDGQWIGFFAVGKLRKVSVTDGRILTLCDVPNPRGATWGSDDTIIFSPGRGTGLWRVPAAGGTPLLLTTPDTAKGEFGHDWPEILPGGQAVLFTIDIGAGFDNARIAVQSLRTGERYILVEGGTGPRYAPTGHLVYARAKALLAVPFDLKHHQVTGPPVAVLQDVEMNSFRGAPQFSFSRDGSLVYVPATVSESERTLVWVDRRGVAQPLPATPRAFFEPRLSPDGQRVALTIEGVTYSLWVYDLARNTLTRLTSGSGEAIGPTWTPDGKRVTFTFETGGRSQPFWKPADGSGPEKQILEGQFWQFPSSWSPDGRFLAFTEFYPPTGWDIWVLPMNGKPRLFLRTPFNEGGARFSLDGRWLAYLSQESGRNEIYVQPFPGPGQKWQISTEGGTEPVWAPNGRELFYRTGDKMMAVTITTNPTFSVGEPRVLFEGRFARGDPGDPNYDVTPDGQRFLMVRSDKESKRTQLNLVVNWFEELISRVPPRKR